MAGSKSWSAFYPLNIRAAKNVVDGDEETLRELFQIFLEHLPEQMEQLRTAVQKNDGKNTRFYAHQIKGAMRNFAAETACTKAYTLEKAGNENRMNDAREFFGILSGEIEVVKNYIEKGGWKKYF